ncbi:uncharacterized protein LY89DRAFT_761186 [Mollisia scopiformis]|uniref:Uncharacterized protein n=1 Tax=Mollisia scopiformis TaxID=149040 RepID=A0A132BD42_MOLSC|nr:uncharacterized protein LY89DRAFT_761186 [Mollisia scopiformis]KUJ09577.1 hypothetical protein LY89DRAFT_761186 [Mollisia scopiformis]
MAYQPARLAPRKSGSVQEAFRFLDLFSEIRNKVYSLALDHEHPVSIKSPRNHRKKTTAPATAFACLLRVNKQVNKEAKGVFYAENTFVVGNGWWGSKTQENHQAFISRVPKECISLIRHVHIIMFAGEPDNFGRCLAKERDTKELKGLGTSLVKHFSGIEMISLTVGDETSRQNPHTNSVANLMPGILRRTLVGDVQGLAWEVRTILDGLAAKKLKEIRWLEDGMTFAEFSSLVQHEELKVEMKLLEWKDEVYVKSARGSQSNPICL